MNIRQATYRFENIRVEYETPKALHVEIANAMYWVPKSQIVDSQDTGEGVFVYLVVKLWWAEKSGAMEAYEEYAPVPKPAENALVISEFMTDLNELWQGVTADIRTSGKNPSEMLYQATGIFRRLALKYHPDRNGSHVH